MKLSPWHLLPIFGIVLFSQCKKDDTRPVIAQETINALTMSFKASDGSDSTTFSYVDSDGPGGADPVILGDTLTVNTVYLATLTFANGATDVTETIKSTSEDHQVFFAGSSELGLTFYYEDQDGDGHPVGLLSSWKAVKKGTGILRVTLVHQPNKSATGVAQGNINTAGGKIDIEVDFPLVIN